MGKRDQARPHQTFHDFWSEASRTFPKYSALIFALAFVFQIPDSAYVGNFVLFFLQPALIIVLYATMLKAPRLVWQRIIALALIAVCIWSAPYTRHGGQLLAYIVIAEASLLFTPLFGYLAITLSALVIWVISPVLNDLRTYHTLEFQSSSIYILFAGILFMLYTVQSGKLQHANTKLRHNVRQIESLTLSRERARMASEMHDSIGQQLTAIHYAHESAFNTVSKADDIPETTRAAILKPLTRAEGITKETLTEVRQMARALDPSAFGQKLTNESVDAMARSFGETGLDMRTEIVGDVNLLGADAQTLLFRALQETLTNAIRHAHATKVDLSVVVGSRETTLRVEDDGPGIDADDIDHGFGLSALRERACQIGGSLSLGESQELGGASVTLTIPMRVDGTASVTSTTSTTSALSTTSEDES
ncbi:sensor histidine kinase [Bifidobacterium sp. ESL0790]|uniref:sensor histidine kinase n=1 Tax=Bifidobacterium sp. ESL0790 TaxID=2983233 RepID=UPI0023FA194C|nr:sensor histidine kinase [Bifidobacterium sp. ESL0790]WEV71917.1 sensor histidine kinase [Bifidobacterium sp. ESL0790]